jgi:hypothetical protein
MDSNVGHVNTGGNREDKLVIIIRGGGVVSKRGQVTKMQMHLYTPEVRVLYRLYIPT